MTLERGSLREGVKFELDSPDHAGGSMQTLCFASNMSSEEIAAWFQAIGTILTIAAGIGTVAWQNNVDVNRRRRETVDREIRSAGAAIFFGKHAVSALKGLEDAITATNQTGINSTFAALQDQLEWGGKISLTDLTPDAAEALLDLREIVLEVLSYRAAVTPTLSRYASFRQYSNAATKKLDSLIAAVKTQTLPQAR